MTESSARSAALRTFAWVFDRAIIIADSVSAPKSRWARMSTSCRRSCPACIDAANLRLGKKTVRRAYRRAEVRRQQAARRHDSSISSRPGTGEFTGARQSPRRLRIASRRAPGPGWRSELGGNLVLLRLVQDLLPVRAELRRRLAFGSGSAPASTALIELFLVHGSPAGGGGRPLHRMRRLGIRSRRFRRGADAPVGNALRAVQVADHARQVDHPDRRQGAAGGETPHVAAAPEVRPSREAQGAQEKCPVSPRRSLFSQTIRR